MALEDDTKTSGYSVYMCNETHVAASTFNADSSYWTEVSVNAASAFFTYLIAKNANIKILASAQFTIADANGTVVAGLINDTIPLWIGASLPSNAPFRVTRAGVLYATGAQISGTITATAGKIGGFKISGNGLTNENDNGTFTNDAYVILRNDSHRCFVGIGPNVLPSYSTARALARFEIEDNDDWFGGGANIALVLRAKNNTRNFAFMGEGNGVLNGWIGGCKFTKLTLSAANTIYSGSGYAELKTNNTFLVYSSVSNSGIGLPRLTEVRSALGINSTTNFAVLVTIVSDLNSETFTIRGRCRTQDSGGSTPWNTTELPLITHWDGSNWDDVPMGAGDSVTFLLVYDMNKSLYIDNYSCFYTARILNRQD